MAKKIIFSDDYEKKGTETRVYHIVSKLESFISTLKLGAIVPNVSLGFGKLIIIKGSSFSISIDLKILYNKIKKSKVNFSL